MADTTTTAINPFDTSNIHATLSQALAAIPPGHDGAFLLDGTDSQKTGAAVQALFAMRGPKGWSFGLGASYDKAAGWGAQVAVVDTFDLPHKAAAPTTVTDATGQTFPAQD